MSQHTPGPWHLRAAGRAITDSRGWDIARLPNSNGPISLEEMSANGRLMGKAPEMLALIRAHLLAYPHDEYTDRILALLAKIEGKE